MLKVSYQILLELLLFILLFFNIFVLKTSELGWIVLELLSFGVILFILIKYRRPTKIRANIHYYIIVGGCLLSQGILYLFGTYMGFSNSYSAIYKTYLSKNYTISVFLIVIITEFIRYITLLNLKHTEKNIKYKISRVVMLLNYIMIDYIILGEIYNFNSYYEILNLLILFVIPTLTKNIFLDYSSQKYGYLNNYIYRLIMDLYIFFVPVIPNVNVFIKTVVISLLPYYLYVSLEKLTGTERKERRVDRKRSFRRDLIPITVLGILIYLISCQFTYCMIAVGSESMHGSLDKGDAVIYKKYANESLNEGQIIVFQNSNTIIIHRIVSVIEGDNGVQAYITKGDANTDNDNWIVTRENVIGVVKMRILLIAWPSVMLSELL